MNTDQSTGTSAPDGHDQARASETGAGDALHDLASAQRDAPGAADHQSGATPAPGAAPVTTAERPAPRHGLATLQPTPEQIRAARVLAGQTQEQAAELVHVTGRAWRRWESGERLISGAAWELYLIKALGFAPIK